MNATQLQLILPRSIGTARLDPGAISSIESDENAGWSAAVVVGITGLANGLALSQSTDLGYLAIVTAFAGNYVAWLVFGTLVFLIGVGVLPGESTQAEATPGGVLRPLGFATAPNILGVAGVFGITGQVLGLIGLIWMAVCGFVVIRVTLRVTRGRALAIWAISSVLTIMLLNIVAAVIG